jgi:hypothetical protein
MRPWRTALTKFWAPVPWMLEAVIVLQVVLHEYVEAAVIAGLLAFDAALGFGPRPPGRRLRAGAGKRVRSLPCAADPRVVEVMLNADGVVWAERVGDGVVRARISYLAQTIHAKSSRTQAPFVAVNTSAIPQELLEAEIFCHVRGAFTGAVQQRNGAFCAHDFVGDA